MKTFNKIKMSFNKGIHPKQKSKERKILKTYRECYNPPPTKIETKLRENLTILLL